jgi:hypothetical protein
MRFLLLLAALTISGCTLDQTERVERGARGLGELTEPYTNAPVVGPAAEAITTVAVAVGSICAMWAAYQRRKLIRVTAASEDVIRSLEPVLKEPQKEMLSKSMSEEGKILVIKARAS